MMKQLIKIALLALWLPALPVTGCQAGSSPAQQNAQGTVKTLQPKEFARELAASPGAQLVDVRTPEEYGGGHLDKSANIDYRNSDFDARIAKLDKSKPVFVYCHSGRRSAGAADKLQSAGFTHIVNMDGGISSWEEQGLPVVK